jgi:peptidyl-tRNA hydrolase, PTH1 family
MKLIVGLGNPGRRYAGTRHNVGFEVLNLLAERHSLEWTSGPADAIVAKWRRAPAAAASERSESSRRERGWGPASSEFVLLAKPLTFMNLSGQAVGELLRFYKIDFGDLLVLVDDANLELGRLRARPGGSAGGHNGLKSLIELLGTEGFPRLRVGVGRGDGRRDLADHVLATFDPQERTIVAEAVGRAADAAELFIDEGIGTVMNRFNRKEDGNQKEDGD